MRISNQPSHQIGAQGGLEVTDATPNNAGKLVEIIDIAEQFE